MPVPPAALPKTRTSLRVVCDYRTVAEQDRGACAVIGNFDGVHLGHQTIINLARDAARRHGTPLGVVTFEPHPRSLFGADPEPFRLTPPSRRAERLAQIGVDKLYQLPFDAALADLSPEDFVRKVIHAGLGLKHVVVGANFRFGKRRAGDTATLETLCAEYGIGVSVAPLVQDPFARISSTSIRRALASGQPRLAAERMGDDHRVVGVARRTGANDIALTLTEQGHAIADLMLPRPGLYSITAEPRGDNARQYRGLARIYQRVPPFQTPVQIDLTLFHGGDFHGDDDLNGAELSVALCDYHGDCC